jgi:hypothetical protein
MLLCGLVYVSAFHRTVLHGSGSVISSHFSAVSLQDLHALLRRRNVLTLFGGRKNKLVDCTKPADGPTTVTSLHCCC